MLEIINKKIGALIMSNGYLGNANKSYYQQKWENSKSTRCSNSINHDILKKNKVKSTPKLGPRIQFCHYVFDLKWDVDKAIDEILKNYKALNRNILLEWLQEEKQKRENGRMSSNDGR